jgi:hypothetical protein
MLTHKVDCSNGLLATDIALIALNETHAVFSVRVERATLAKNHFFLNVISDVAGCGDEFELAPPPAPKSRGVAAAWGWVSLITRRRAGSAAS